MEPFTLTTPEVVRRNFAARARALRLAKGWKQSTLAERSGVSLASLRRFEESGRISFEHLLALAMALGRLAEFESLFAPPRATSIAELEARQVMPTRKRGRL